MYILVSKNSFDGTKKYNYSTREQALNAYESTKFVIDMPGGPDWALTLYENYEDESHIIKKHLKIATR